MFAGPGILRSDGMNLRVKDNLLRYEGQEREAQKHKKPPPLPCVPYLKAWIRPHLQKAAEWSLLGHLLFFLICLPILGRIPREKSYRVIRIRRYSDLMPPPSILERGPTQDAQSDHPFAEPVSPGWKYTPKPAIKTGRAGMPVPVKASAVPEREEWRPAGSELPPEESLFVRKSSFHDARPNVAVRPDLGDQKKMADLRPSDPEVKVASRSEQRDQQRVTLKLSVLGGYSGVSGKIAYIQRTLGDMDRASFPFRDATIYAFRNEAKVRFDNGRTFAVYFSADWRLGRIEIDLESEASDRAKEMEALRAIDFLERALKSQSN